MLAYISGKYVHTYICAEHTREEIRRQLVEVDSFLLSIKQVPRIKYRSYGLVAISLYRLGPDCF